HLESLKGDLLANYSRNIIPQKYKDIPIKIKFDIALNQIIDLDERLQTITTIVWVRLYWTDFRLRWNHTKYGGIKSFVTPSRQLWLPDITLYNNANDNYEKEKEEYYGLTVNSDGSIGWYYPTIFKSSCTIDVTYFPFDDQKCILKFGSWSYHGLSLDIFHSGPGDIKSFTDNGEWVLVDMPATKHVTKYRCCPEPYPYLTYDIIIRRRTMYYILNFLTPCVLMSALTVLGFFLPVESGERMNVGVTVLLSLTVILLLLAEELPATSEVVPLISRYYTITMINVFVSIVFTCVVLTFHHHAPEPLPGWVRLVICKWFATIFRITRHDVPPDDTPKKNKYRKKRGYSASENHCSDDCQDNLTMIHLNSESEKESCTVNLPLKRTGNGNAMVRRRISQIIKPAEGLDVLINRAKKDEEKEQYREEWKFAAHVLNKVFMWIVLLLVVFNCVSVIISAPSANLGT
ncbi:predicted protein, partial [Nematostella vectensis]